MNKEVIKTQQDLAEETINVSYDVEEREAELNTLNKQINTRKLLFIGIFGLFCLVLVARIIYG